MDGAEGVGGYRGHQSDDCGYSMATTIPIAILPLTYWRTNLHSLNVGAPVNIEADVLVKLAPRTYRCEEART